MILLSQVYYYKSSGEPAAAAEKGNLIFSSHPQEWLCTALCVAAGSCGHAGGRRKKTN